MVRTTTTALLALAAAIPLAAALPNQRRGWAKYKYVFQVSVDGMHSSDVEKYLAIRPKSAIAGLLATGYEYTGAYTTGVRDSAGPLERPNQC